MKESTAGAKTRAPAVTAAIMALLALALAATAQAASLEAPDEATIGSSVEVGWTGPGENYDTVYIVPVGADDAASGIYSTTILNGRNPVAVTMPDDPGAYELRYWHRSAGVVAARRTITTVDVATSLEAPAQVKQGATIEVHWQGPGNQYDRVDLLRPGDPADARPITGAGIISSRNPLSLRMPDAPGPYELRYRTRATGRELAARPIVVEGVVTSIEAPDTAQPGSNIEISWEGPGNDYDGIGIVAAGAAPDAQSLVRSAILSGRNPLQMRLPETPGAFELRYLTAQSQEVLATRPITLVDLSATLSAPERATAATTIDVTWEGPGNDYDRIGVFPADAPDDADPLATAAILSARNPLPLKLPDPRGNYELRYLTAQEGRVLARREILVEPAGRLAVVFQRSGETSSAAAGGGVGAVELILDASGSMLQRLDGERRIDIAKAVLDDLVRNRLGDERKFALRVFGHKEADSCRTDLEIPLSDLDRAGAAGRIGGINAMNLARTPIADSLAQVPADLAEARGPKTVILLTDGEETCDGDPAAVIEQLRRSGLDVQISVVGFAIDDADLKATFERWADLGGGGYFDARSAEELTRSLNTVISGPFRVLDGEGNLAGEGIIGGAPIVLPAGTYRVETRSTPPRVLEGARVEPEALTEAAF